MTPRIAVAEIKLIFNKASALALENDHTYVRALLDEIKGIIDDTEGVPEDLDQSEFLDRVLWRGV